MSWIIETPRALDHCVLPVADLETARRRMEALGFTVAPEGVHPFGTANACVYFADGTFLEPLAHAEPERIRAAASEGNVFVARDLAWRSANGAEGFSALVVTSDDAQADHADLVERGVSIGPILDFSRGYRDAEGRERTVSFRLAFGGTHGEGDAFLFACQRIDAPPGGRGALERHGNGVTGIARVTMRSDSPFDHAGILAACAFGKARRDGEGRRAAPITLAGDEPGFDNPHGTPQTRCMALSSIVFAVADLAGLRDLLAARSVAFRNDHNLLVVDPAPGQGTIFAFEEIR